jgi:hypothetical protein
MNNKFKDSPEVSQLISLIHTAMEVSPKKVLGAAFTEKHKNTL